MDRPSYRALLKAVKKDIEAQKAEKRGLVSITPGHYTFVDGHRLNSKDVEKAWPSVVKDLGLVDDGTAALGRAMGIGSGITSWTVPGFGYVANVLDKDKKEQP